MPDRVALVALLLIGVLAVLAFALAPPPGAILSDEVVVALDGAPRLLAGVPSSSSLLVVLDPPRPGPLTLATAEEAANASGLGTEMGYTTGVVEKDVDGTRHRVAEFPGVDLVGTPWVLLDGVARVDLAPLLQPKGT